MLEAMKLIPLAFLLLCVGGLVAGAAALATNGISTSITQKCFNSSWTYTTNGGGVCNNNTDMNGSSAGKDSLNFSDAYYAVFQAQKGNTNVASNFGTMGTIAAMVVIISMLGSAMVYFRYFQ